MRGQNDQGNTNDNNSQNGESLALVTDIHIIPGVDSYNLRKIVHIPFNCNEPYHSRNRIVNILKVGYVFAQHNDKDVIFKTWILIYTCSTTIISNN